jgi:Domain of unknown function (DUF5615)
LQPLLFDQGLPTVAPALAALRIDANAVGLPGAPPEGSSDEDNCKWCKEHDAVLVTHDRGRTNREILSLLAEHRVHAVFVYPDLRRDPVALARAILNAGARMDEIVGGRHLLHHRLKPTGRLEKR